MVVDVVDCKCYDPSSILVRHRKWHDYDDHCFQSKESENNDSYVAAAAAHGHGNETCSQPHKPAY